MHKFTLITLIIFICSAMEASGAKFEKIHDLNYQKSGTGITGYFADFENKHGLLVVNHERNVVVFDELTGLKVTEFKTAEKLWNIRVSPDGKLLLSGFDKDVALLDLKTGKELKRFKAASRLRTYFFVGADRLATCSEDGEFNIWEIASGKALYSRNFRKKFLTCTLSISKDRVFIKDYLKTVWVFDLKTSKLNEHSFRVLQHDTNSGYFFEELPGQSGIGFRKEQDLSVSIGQINSVRTRMYPNLWPRFSPDRERIYLIKFVVSTYYGEGSLVETSKMSEVKKLGENWNPIAETLFSPNSRYLLISEPGASAQSVNAKLVHADTGQQVWSLPFDQLAPVVGPPSSGLFKLKAAAPLKVVFSPSGDHLALGNEQGKVRILETLSGKEVHSYDHGAKINRLYFSPNGTKFFSASLDGNAKLFKTGFTPFKGVTHRSNLALLWVWKDYVAGAKKLSAAISEKLSAIPPAISCLAQNLNPDPAADLLKNSCEALNCSKTVQSHFMQPWNRNSLDYDDLEMIKNFELAAQKLRLHLISSGQACP